MKRDILFVSLVLMIGYMFYKLAKTSAATAYVSQVSREVGDSIGQFFYPPVDPEIEYRKAHALPNYSQRALQLINQVEKEVGARMAGSQRDLINQYVKSGDDARIVNIISTFRQAHS